MRMKVTKGLVLLASAAVTTALLSPVLLRAQTAAPAPAPTSAKTWIGHAAEIEEYLKTVEIVSTTTTSVGVTHPSKATLPPGGPCRYLSFKPIAPGPYNGAMESYKSEIAAYELDKLLQLNMVPPTVEKTYKKQKGAAVMWLDGVKTFVDFPSAKNGGAPTAPPDKAEFWNHQITRAKMFDNLIGNQDPNLGNWLVDANWNLAIIDHTRALFGDTTMPHVLNHVDADLWDKMKALTIESITPALSPWMSKGDIKSIIQRRDILQKKIDELVKKNGAANVFFKDSGGGL